VNSEEAVIAMAKAFNALGIPFMLSGSMATNYYGISRSTKDADFVVQMEGFSIVEVAKRLGPPFRLDPQMSFETVTGTYRHIFLIEGSPFKVEVFLVSQDEHDRERFARRVRMVCEDTEIWVSTVEDVIVTKLRWSKQGRRTKDVDDVRNVIAVQADAIDWEYVYRWCDVHNTHQLLDQIRASIPPI
jgi:hypothetical protein